MPSFDLTSFPCCRVEEEVAVPDDEEADVVVEEEVELIGDDEEDGEQQLTWAQQVEKSLSSDSELD